MSLKSDGWIRDHALKQGMIEPFSEHTSRKGILSYGLSSYGYDMRLSNEFQIYAGGTQASIDPKRFDAAHMKAVKTNACWIPPNSYVLGRSLEYFRIPRNILTLCFGKSSYARSGILINVTPFEPGWEGYATLSISNTTPVRARLYAQEGIAQILFLEGSEACLTSYADRKGRYQAAQTIQHAKA